MNKEILTLGMMFVFAFGSARAGEDDPWISAIKIQAVQKRSDKVTPLKSLVLDGERLRFNHEPKEWTEWKISDRHKDTLEIRGEGRFVFARIRVFSTVDNFLPDVRAGLAGTTFLVDLPKPNGDFPIRATRTLNLNMSLRGGFTIDELWQWRSGDRNIVMKFSVYSKGKGDAELKSALKRYRTAYDIVDAVSLDVYNLVKRERLAREEVDADPP